MGLWWMVSSYVMNYSPAPDYARALKNRDFWEAAHRIRHTKRRNIRSRSGSGLPDRPLAWAWPSRPDRQSWLWWLRKKKNLRF